MHQLYNLEALWRQCPYVCNMYVHICTCSSINQFFNHLRNLFPYRSKYTSILYYVQLNRLRVTYDLFLFVRWNFLSYKITIFFRQVFILNQSPFSLIIGLLGHWWHKIKHFSETFLSCMHLQLQGNYTDIQAWFLADLSFKVAPGKDQFWKMWNNYINTTIRY
jgi:hypothetical protein